MNIVTQKQKQLSIGMLVAAAVVLSFILTTNASYHDKESMGKSGEHRSAIANLAKELNQIADRDGGIGKDLREVARAQNDSKEKVADAVDEVENRSGLKTFFLGTDYKNLGALRSEMVTADNHIDRLMKAKERVVNQATATDLDEQISALQAEKTKIESFIKENEDKFGLFGWFVKLFTK